MIINRIILALLGIFIALSILLAQAPQKDLLASDYSKQSALKSPEWVKDVVIYCVYLRSFSQEGTFGALEKRLPELKGLGVSVLWLMPIHPVGVKNRKGSLGSPYSVRDYYTTNPEFGTMVDFQKLLSSAHKNKMRLIIDLVANHTAWDSKLISQHPEWFTRDSDGNIVSPNSDWTDVADLDYSKPGLRKYMLEMMEWWIKDIGIDGFRCDVSELVPLDFWEEARTRLDKIKPVMMLSEGSLPEQHLQAFDITYAWNLHDALYPLLTGKKPASELDKILEEESSRFPSGSLRLRFNTNHDKNAWDAPAVTKFGLDGLKLTAVLINTFPGIPLLYNGEEVANNKILSLFEKVEIDWNRLREMDTLYRTLFLLRQNHKALSRGNLLKIPTPIDNDVYAFFRTDAKDNIFTILNFSNAIQSFDLQIPFDALFGKKNKVKMKEVFTNSTLTFERGKTHSISIAPHGYQIFTVDK